MTGDVIVLELPEPPSPNRGKGHPMTAHRAKRRYQRKAWLRACEQIPPPATPPARVRIDADFRLWNKRDEDNLAGSLKWLIDALRERQTGKRHWRQGVYSERGFFHDDDPRYLTLGRVTQNIDRSNRGVTLTITPLSPTSGDTDG